MSHGGLKRDVIALMDRLSAEVRAGGGKLIAGAVDRPPEILQ